MIKNLQNACNKKKTNGSKATIIKSWKTILQTMWTTKSTVMTSQKKLSLACHVKITKCHKIWHYADLMKSHAQMM